MTIAPPLVRSCPWLASIPATVWATDVRANDQSALAPKGEAAARIAEMAWVMTIGATLIFLLVAVLLCLAIWGPAAVRRRIRHRALIIGAGVAFPTVVLTALLVYTLGPDLHEPGEEDTLHVEVTGEMWWWRVRYHDARGGLLFETANDIRIPAGVPVVFTLKAADVIHSFWVPSLGGKRDMVPGHVNRLRLRADAPGVYQGQCAEYCGAQHARMRLEVHALEAGAFEAWIDAQQRPAREPETALLRQGRERFLVSCAECHTVRGTAAAGTSGPDLTHLADRRTLGAGLLPNNIGTLAGWIAASQQLKPGNFMPSFDTFSGAELRALAAYLDSLE